MVYVGFDEEPVVTEELDEEAKKEQEKTRKSALEKFEAFQIPKKRLKEFEDQFDCVVVQDFGDEYHLSEEEREERNSFYKIFRRMKRMKHRYGELDAFVDAVREALKCLDAVAKENGVYSEKKFKKLYFEGKIKVNGLKFPIYKGRDKKVINYKFLTDFIFSDKPAKEILPEEREELITEEDYKRAEEMYFSEGEVERILNESKQTEEEYLYSQREYDEDYDNAEDFAIVKNRKETKKILKAFPELVYAFKEIRHDAKLAASSKDLHQYVFDFAMDDIDYIERYDREHSPADNGFAPPEFTGDLMNDKDYKKYLLLLDEWEDKYQMEYYAGEYKTKEKVNYLSTLEDLAEAGFNVIKFYGQEDVIKKQEKALKRDKKKEKEIKKALLEIEERRKGRRSLSSIGKKAKKKGKKKKDPVEEIKSADRELYEEGKKDILDWRL